MHQITHFYIHIYSLKTVAIIQFDARCYKDGLCRRAVSVRLGVCHVRVLFGNG